MARWLSRIFHLSRALYKLSAGLITCTKKTVARTVALAQRLIQATFRSWDYLDRVKIISKVILFDFKSNTTTVKISRADSYTQALTSCQETVGRVQKYSSFMSTRNNDIHTIKWKVCINFFTYDIVRQ